MGAARNAFYSETGGMGCVLVVSAWDRGLSHSSVSMLPVEKKETDSAHKYQTWQHKAVSACAGLHMGASACVKTDLCQPLFLIQGVGGAAFLL